MPIPTVYDLKLPILELLSDGKTHHNTALFDYLAQRFNLTEAEKNEHLPSGGSRLYQRISWARKGLRDAVLLEYIDRGSARITERGHRVLADKPHKIDRAFLLQFEEFRNINAQKTRDPKPEKEVLQGKLDSTPAENLEEAYRMIRADLADKILEEVRNCSPSFFERLVVDVLVAMGYGGSREEAGKAVGGSGDGGIDGIINEDRLGLEVIYIQAKRWESAVGRPEIQKFVGALAGRKAGKGVFITASTFIPSARDYVKDVGTRIILIDGRQLAEFMIDYNVGVTTEAVYELKRVDTAYFEDE